MRTLNRSGLLLAAAAVAGMALAGPGWAGRYSAAPWDLGVARAFDSRRERGAFAEFLAQVPGLRNPIRLARYLLDQDAHVMLCGPEAMHLETGMRRRSSSHPFLPASPRSPPSSRTSSSRRVSGRRVTAIRHRPGGSYSSMRMWSKS